MTTAWNDISPDSIVKGFTKCRCCVSDDMNLTDDDVFWQGDDENSSSSGW
jgi:hypothetical protein